MKIALAVIATVLQVLPCCDAYAHGDHKPKHGGIMGRGDDEISVELVMEKAAALPAKLIPVGDNKFSAKGLTPVSGDRLRAGTILPSGEEFSSIFSFR